MKEKTKELADSVGAVYPVLFMGRHDGVLFTETELETFVDLAVAAEREACAKFIESTDLSTLPRAMMMHYAMIYKRIATDIRARGTT